MKSIKFNDYIDSTGVSYKRTDLETTIEDIYDKIDNIEPLDIYSTNETIVGKWINGENVYRRVLDFGTVSSEKALSAIPNFKRIIKYTGAGYLQQYSQWLGIPNTHTQISNWYINFLVNGGKPTIRLGSYFSGSGALYQTYVILDYLKN